MCMGICNFTSLQQNSSSSLNLSQLNECSDVYSIEVKGLESEATCFQNPYQSPRLLSIFSLWHYPSSAWTMALVPYEAIVSVLTSSPWFSRHLWMHASFLTEWAVDLFNQTVSLSVHVLPRASACPDLITSLSLSHLVSTLPIHTKLLGVSETTLDLGHFSNTCSLPSMTSWPTCPWQTLPCLFGLSYMPRSQTGFLLTSKSNVAFWIFIVTSPCSLLSTAPLPF